MSFIKDPLAEAKLGWFVTFATPVEIFLKKYQTDKPMGPFLVTDLNYMLNSLAQKIVRSTFIDSSTNVLELDLKKENILKSSKDIDFGCRAKTFIRELIKNAQITFEEIAAFKGKAKEGVIVFIDSLKIKSLANDLARALSSLRPQLIINKQPEAVEQFEVVLSKLSKAKQMNENHSDILIDKFRKFATECATSESFKNFKESSEKDRLDVLYFRALNNVEMYEDLWEVIRKILLLSHGQATVEHGFSFNKQAMEVNQKQDNLISRRVIKDHLTYLGGIKEFEIMEPLLQACSQAFNEYKTADQARKDEKLRAKNLKKKEPIEAQLEAVVEDKKNLQDDME